MGFNDRDYARQMRNKPPPMPRVSKALLISNILIFVIDLLGRANGQQAGPLNEWGAYTIQEGFFGGHLYQLLTFQFLHHSVGHILFNSIGLYFFAPVVERAFGPRKFLVYYLTCGVGGALFYTLLYFIGLMPTAIASTQLVGASAGLFGLFFAVYCLAPQIQVSLLFPPVTLPLSRLALFVAGYAVFMILGGWIAPNVPLFWNSGGEAGHLGGILVGLLLMKYPQSLAWTEGGGSKVIRPKQFRRRPPKVRPRTSVELDAEDEVDRILDKINEQGSGSLTASERKVLEEATKRSKK
jgi:membrane associated rhomboid family serine protease